VIASQAGHTQPHYRPSRTKALASTSGADLVGLPFLQPDHVTNSGGAYPLAKRANILRVQAESMTWGDKGARLNSLSPGIFMTPLGMDELNGPGGEGYQRMIKASAAGRVGTPTRSARQPHS
jgi:NAD(P)-dependent dehydrogenase (short-subunit alcohol dehydrogenase family)